MSTIQAPQPDRVGLVSTACWRDSPGQPSCWLPQRSFMRPVTAGSTPIRRFPSMAWTRQWG